jgi:hypothetical protein
MREFEAFEIVIEYQKDMNIRLALRIGLEKFLHLLEGNCGIQGIVSVKKSKQVIEEQQIHI